MIIGIGSDVAEVHRIRASRERFGERFLRRVFTEAEARYALSKAEPDERLAGRFAAKEAAMKALGTGLTGGITWQDIEVTRAASGRPGIRLSGKAAEIAQRLGVARSHLTITHTADIAFAVVILEAD